MELGNFGAVLGFAIGLEQALADFYQKLRAFTPTEPSTILDQACEGALRRAKMLARVRRENVAEMILEPISDFPADPYALPALPSPGAAPEACRAALQRAEATAMAFYLLGAEKLSIPEVKRIFQRLAREHGGLLGVQR